MQNEPETLSQEDWFGFSYSPNGVGMVQNEMSVFSMSNPWLLWQEKGQAESILLLGLLHNQPLQQTRFAGG